MLALFLALMAAAWLIEAADDDTVHAAVVFIRTGERTPELRSVHVPQTLSALGARQIFELGQNFRGRYINGLGGHVGLGQSQIATIHPDILNNNEVYVMTRQEPYLIASAQSFMQGFYPPFSLNSNSSSGSADSRGILANGTVIDYPLNGYQYPEIRTAGEHDPYSIYLGGNVECPSAWAASINYYTTEDYQNTFTSAEPIYNSLDPSMFRETIDDNAINYHQAYEVYDYVSYQYTHNSSVFEQFGSDSTYEDIYDQLRYLSDREQWYRWGNVTGSGDMYSDIQAMAGKTLSALILGQLQNVIEDQYNDTSIAEAYPVTFLFGDHEPFISLFSLLGLDYVNEHFKAVPPWGSAMIFELISGGSSTTFPDDKQNLYVRFRYQNGTAFNGEPQSYPLFGRSPNTADMPWQDFEASMSSIMVNAVRDWCSTCNSGALFCWGVDDSTIIIDNGRYGRHSKISPTVAGVIGAVVTLAVVGLLFALAAFVGGVRFHRVDRSRKSDLGGFKGSAKLASDADLHLPSHAAGAGIVSFGAGADRKEPKERVGSWELRQKEAGVMKSNFGGEEVDRRSLDDIEAALARPVQAHERV